MAAEVSFYRKFRRKFKSHMSLYPNLSLPSKKKPLILFQDVLKKSKKKYGGRKMKKSKSTKIQKKYFSK